MAAPAPRGATRVVTVCTGNVARSVMLSVMVQSLSGAQVRSRGTHTVEGLGVSARTLAALASTGVDPAPARAHRSAPLTADDLAWADVVLCAEAGQVALARALSPRAPVATVGQFARASGDLAARLAASSAPDPALDVADPAGGDQAAYDECARVLWGYAREVAPLL